MPDYREKRKLMTFCKYPNVFEVQCKCDHFVKSTSADKCMYCRLDIDGVCDWAGQKPYRPKPKGDDQHEKWLEEQEETIWG